jgi:hypothetical protein
MNYTEYPKMNEILHILWLCMMFCWLSIVPNWLSATFRRLYEYYSFGALVASSSSGAVAVPIIRN